MSSDPANVAKVSGSQLPPGFLWDPVVGSETKKIKMPPGSQERVLLEARNILAKCNAPGACSAPRVGLAVGCVQSGKTLNFTTVCALARDNDFQLIIVITGVATNLYDQSTERLLDQLGIKERKDREIIQYNYDLKAPEPLWLKGRLSEWSDPGRPREKKTTVIITVLKHHRHLQKLVEILGRLEVKDAPALIIDDEADQAGLNSGVNSGPGRQSTTYRQILALKTCLPRHTYLQYTATPQAPLLINLIDALSPSFVEVLVPGAGYTGGITFFRERAASAIKVIPQAEVWGPNNQLTDPPQTFKDALASFIVCATDGDLKPPDDDNCRSMLIHPHQTTDRHSIFFRWAVEILKDWKDLLGNTSDPDYSEVCDLLQRQYDDLKATFPDIKAFDEILANAPSVLSQVNIQEINASNGKTPRVEWSHAYSHILVGGQAMDRGFTVRGLTTTYMPRPMGGGTADTLQQRARFFGYKEPYIGPCRVWLENGVRRAFTSYVEHEESIRRQLIEFNEKGRDLHEWKRAFFLDRSLRPTRRQVLSLAYVRDNHSDDWVIQERPHHLKETLEHNNRIISEFSTRLSFAPHPDNAGRTLIQKHNLCSGVPLNTIIDLLSEMKISDPDDSSKFVGLMLELSEAFDRDEALLVDVILMSPNGERERSRREGSDEVNPHQGPNPPTYPGDSAIHSSTRVSVQLHRLKSLKPHPNDGGETFSDVWLIAVFVPAFIGKDHLVQ